ncbi:MAG: transposase [Thermodesulfobacteriota bacterium]|nr:transposase [Thermodesulfobacteriota bacterium]
MRYLRDCIDQLTWRFSAGMMFPRIPTIKFEDEKFECSCCSKKLKVLKTQTKTAATLEIGQFIIHETIKWCDNCNEFYRSDEPEKLVPYSCKFGFNVLVYVGMGLFVRHQNEKQIQGDLKDHNIPISIRQVGYLAKKFIVYLALAHKESQEKIKTLLLSRGGYILHLDATCEGDSPHLMTALDEIAKIILDNIKMPSEKADKIIPFLGQLKKSYGIPVAIVHDMGAGILSAVKEVFPCTPDYICHYHFLRDIGNDLFGNEYARIRNELKKRRIRFFLRQMVKALKAKIETEPDLSQSFDTYLKKEGKARQILPPVLAYIFSSWILDANSESQGYGFPFDRPHFIFYKRLHAVKDVLSSLSTKKKKDRYILKLNNAIVRITKDRNLRRVVSSMEEKAQIFDQLRDAMRIALADGQKGLNDDGEDADIKTIKDAVVAFRNSARIEKAIKNNVDYKKMVDQIDKYWEKLFADPIAVNTTSGEQLLVQPQRTNNILERFFRDLKRMYRKKTGHKSLNRVIKSMIADTPLVKNLANPDYMEILLKGKNTLEERFAEIDAKLVRQELNKKEAEQNKIPMRMKKVLKKPDLPFLITKNSKIMAPI